MLNEQTVATNSLLTPARIGSGNDRFFDVSGSVGHGVIGLDGSLGFHGGLVNETHCRRSLSGLATISAHAPSTLTLRLHQPARIFGFLNSSSKSDWANPVEFWADFNFVGRCVEACDETKDIFLDSGEHVLHARCARSAASFGHSVWALAPVDATSHAPPTNHATDDNTAVLTVASYPMEDVPVHLAHLAYSARRQRVRLHVRGVGERYGHFLTKVLSARQWIVTLPERYRFVLYVDCTDTLFARQLAEACDIFNKIGASLVVGAEAISWPVMEHDWRSLFPPQPGNRRWLNAGMWMGERGTVIEALDTLIDLNRRLSQSSPDDALQDVWRWREHRDDDQFLWQVCQLKQLIPMRPDSDCELFANVATMDRRIVGNVDAYLDPVSGRVRVLASGSEPAVLHFSGSANTHCKQQWAGYLHLTDC